MMSEKRKVIGEEANTNVMKLVKSDAELAFEMRQLLEAVVGKMAEMHSRKLVVNIQLDNGEGPFKKPTLAAFDVIKKVTHWQTEEKPQQ